MKTSPSGRSACALAAWCAATTLAVAAPAARAADPPAAAEAAPPAAAEAPAATSVLAQGLARFDELEFEAAAPLLEAAYREGPYGFDDVVRLHHALAITRAYLDQRGPALQLFERLLAIAPDHVLPYTTSPKATFLFEEARQTVARRRSTEVTIAPRLAPRFGKDIELEYTRAADPLELLARLAILVRLPGETNFRRIEVAAPPVGGTASVTLPAVPVPADAAGAPPLAVAVVGYDAAGSEVYRGPSPARPREVYVSFEQPEPWYTQWWIWTLAGVVVAGTAAGVAIAAQPAPTEQQLSFTIRR